MSKSNTWENGLLLLVFNNVSFAGLGDAGGILQSVLDGDLQLSLHIASLGEAGDQATNEVTYPGYLRAAVPRTVAGWTVTGIGEDIQTATNAADVDFPAATGGNQIATHIGIGTAASGPGKLLYSAEMDSPLTIISLVKPRFPAGDIDLTED